MIGIRREIARALNQRDSRPLGWRTRPERIVLAATGDEETTGKPPVRIFIGTEPDQHRAERVLIWSIEHVRDRSRTYEIYLMKDLLGFDRERWLTGFTNYRFAIPHFAGGTGRAIYNDVDQIYLADPAELFDTDMASHGFLCISPRDTSVMLMDCARMAEIWTMEEACRERRKRIEERARAVPGLWGAMAPEWNSRDAEYVAGQSRVLHFTTIHTQPWQPCPERFVYQPNPVGQVWTDLERAADTADFQVFTSQRPSNEYRALLQRLGTTATNGGAPARSPEGLSQLLDDATAASVLVYQIKSGESSTVQIPTRPDRTVTSHWPSATDHGKLARGKFDAVVCAGGLEFLPEEDVPWTIDTMFALARRCVYLRLRESASAVVLPDGNTVARPLRAESWWLWHLETACQRHPSVRWKLVIETANVLGRTAHHTREGGRRMDGHTPTVWVLTDDKEGHTIQSVGLAKALGWPYEEKRIHFNFLNRLNNRLLGATAVTVDRHRSATLAAPWPDLVITTGRRTAPVARWIGERSQGRTRLVQLGRKGGELVDPFDLVVTCSHFRLPLHPRRMEIAAPITTITEARLTEAAEQGGKLFDATKRPRILLVVGGTSATHRLDPATARRMGEEVRATAESADGTLFTITSPRTGAAATAALRSGLGERALVHEWKRSEAVNPYLGYLSRADIVIVTGESESMLAEAVAAGKHVLIYRLPHRRPGPRKRLADWVVRRANARPRKKKGTVRPQQGMEYLCARLIERGLIRPPRDIDELHRTLIRRGVARCFGVRLDDWTAEPLREVEAVAHRVRAMLGFDGVAGPAATSDRLETVHAQTS